MCGPKLSEGMGQLNLANEGVVLVFLAVFIVGEQNHVQRLVHGSQQLAQSILGFRLTEKNNRLVDMM